MTYEATISWLFEQFPAYHLQGVSAYKPSLDNIRVLAEAFGNPQDDLRFIHIAGTNGKGSTSNMLASILTENGQRTGLFTSPHIHDFTERIRVNGICVDEDFVIRFCADVRSKKWEIEPSFFEITWLMALCYFKEQNCTVIVAETGLGGRLDATNIILPLVSVITTISLDHTNILGNTRAAIAFEKAGIIKPNTPVVVGSIDDEIEPVIRQQALINNSNVTIASKLTEYPSTLIGYQRNNFDTVTAVIDELRKLGWEIPQSQIDEGIRNLRKNTGFIGRLEIVGQDPLIVLDCAHNPEGISKTIESIRELQKGNLFILYGTSSDKDIAAIEPLLPDDATYFLTVFRNPRSADLEQLKSAFGESEKKVHFYSNPILALDEMKLAASKEDTLLILGSFFLISDFFEVFFE
ncbi:MAG: bifunctional folylpolyglutamate synthase/dihydrofolate synthase [Flavobacteriia bacterium]|nr:bifunctional folylpolyglutamate synthase/dihydrofolate synthase [Flavobacteriia bacterium]